METSKDMVPREVQEQEKNDDKSLKGTLFSSIVFVGGGIIFFMVLLFVIYMIRV
ncbi:hypothetical protein KFZ58_06940 [Virgibacillus sp. NKC19-16]|uniref:hypothetical protein n=1 Tax=Virgibacillus salidurans TaxID=2831673 RepID=UPI001F21CA7F|nr:hypothetical protein [Virgibacillus sp. NKC19-16]UJL47596.1 hypothetical protein KFZ58_06940 [Virgibacillus sp. NKC19-16]